MERNMIDKKSVLIGTALRLFYDHGINSIGINEVLKESGVAKKTLYNHFSSKDELILATLAARDNIYISWLKAELKGVTTDRALVTQLFTALTEWFKGNVPQLSPFKGCFFINTLAERREVDDAIFIYCAQHKQKIRALIHSYLTSDDESLLDMICLLKEGAIVSAFMSNDVTAAQKCIPLLAIHLDRLDAPLGSPEISNP
jgi:AcrR family transcriptional regulator